MEAFVEAAARIDADPENQTFKVLEQKDADEGQSEDHQDEDAVEHHENQGELLLGNTVRHQIISAEAYDNQQYSHNHLVDGHANILQLLHSDTNLILGPPVQV